MKRERNTFQANERERGGETTVVRISSVAAAAAVPTLYTTYNISLADASYNIFLSVCVPYPARSLLAYPVV
jgi:hypothetical protein